MIGDVVGHDSRAAAAMGPLRGILRGSAFRDEDDPGQVLRAVDEAVEGLELGLATKLAAVLHEGLIHARADACLIRHSRLYALTHDFTPVLLRRGKHRPDAQFGHSSLLGLKRDVHRFTDFFDEFAREAFAHQHRHVERHVEDADGRTVVELCDLHEKQAAVLGVRQERRRLDFALLQQQLRGNAQILSV